MAKGAGGTQEATARVTVEQPAVQPPAVTTSESEQQDFARADMRRSFWQHGSGTLDAERHQRHARLHGNIRGAFFEFAHLALGAAALRKQQYGNVPLANEVRTLRHTL